ncbi:MAG: DUF4150 domain-containing protein [Myxococcales bacterium]|nr:DUF4150 domain-containing protein [Myxococcales bacterium]
MPFFSGGRLVACVASGHLCVTPGPTDVCKTPTPGGPVPMPYPNVGVSATMGPGYTTKTLALMTPTWTKKGKIALTNGDQPGVALGIISNKIMGMVEVMMSSTDVKAENGGVVRSMDKGGNNV